MRPISDDAPAGQPEPITAPDGPFSVTVLGSDGSYPGPGGACSGYLLQADGFFTWLDAGPGTMANIQLHVHLDQLGAVVISHGHPDHWSDLEGLYIALRYFLGRRGLPIYAPEGLRDLMRGENPDGTLDWRVIGEGDSALIGPARWRWSRTDHPMDTMAARVEVAGRALGYSADTGPGWSLSSLGSGITLALVEATMTTEAEGSLQHLSARQAGTMAKEAGADRLVITHLAPDIDRKRARAEAEESFGSPVDVAEVGRTWLV